MRPTFAFLSAASNLKPGGLLKWKKRLGKDVRLFLPLIIVTLRRATLMFWSLGMTLAKAKAWQETCLPFFPKAERKSVCFFLRSVAGSTTSSSSSPIDPLQRRRDWFMPSSLELIFLFCDQRLLVRAPLGFNVQSLVFLPALGSPLLNFLRLLLISHLSSLPAWTKFPFSDN